MSSPPTFSQRIKARRRIWWGVPPVARNWRGLRSAPHRWRDLYTLRRRDDPDDAWRCCTLWQRKVINKWNGREFAIRHGCRVPSLYWRARRPSQRRLSTLPPQFVLRMTWGAHRDGVYAVVGGCDVLRHVPFSAALLHRTIRKSGMLSRALPVLAEEFIPSEDPRYRLPIEYKCHTFGDTVASIEVIERETTKKAQRRFYTAEWQPIADLMHTILPQSPPRDPPRCLDEMLRSATRLGSTFGTYMRVDFFASPSGCIFNEFSSTPADGDNFTPYCDELFGGYWQEKFTDAT